MENIFELIKELERRPALYLGGTTLERLSAFIAGWLTAKNCVEDNQTMVDFRDFVAKKFDVGTNHDWQRIIAFYCMDESNALPRFFELFRDFKERAKPDGVRSKNSAER